MTANNKRNQIKIEDSKFRSSNKAGIIGTAKAALKDSLYLCVQNYRSFSVALALDIILVLLASFVYFSFIEKIGLFVQAVGTIAISASGLNNADPASSIMAIFLNYQTKPLIYSIIYLTILLCISLYIIISVLFSSSTYLIHSIGKFNIDGLKDYVKRSFVTNISWIIILVILNLVSFYIYFSSTVSRTLGLSNSNPSQIFDLVAMLIFFYFFYISISISGRKNFRISITLGIKKLLKLSIYYILLVFGLGVLSLIGDIISRLTGSIIIAAIYEALIVLGFVLFSRLAFKRYLDLIVRDN